MKNLIFILLLCPFFAFSQQADKHFTITGNVDGLPDNSEVSLTDLNNPMDTVSHGVVNKGKFILKGSVQEPNLYQLSFSDARKKTMLFLGNDEVTVKGTVNDLANLEVKGSSTNNDFTDFQSKFNPLFRRLTAMNQQLSAQPEGSDSLMTSYTALLDSIGTGINEFIAEKKASPVSAFLLLVTGQLEQDIAVTEKRFGSLDEAARNSFYGKILKQQIDDSKVGAIGTAAIDFTQNDTTGKPVSLSSFRGKYVLIDFWASWCKPCRMENPNVVAAYNKFHNKNFTILGVSLDRAREPWIAAIKDDNLAWTQVSDLQFWNNEAAVKYHIQSIPQNYLLDPDGKIIGKNLRGPELHAKLCDLLGCE